MGWARHAQAGRVPCRVPGGRAREPRRAQGGVPPAPPRHPLAQGPRRPWLGRRVVAGRPRARRPAVAVVPGRMRGPGADGRRRHGQRAHGPGPVRAGVLEKGRGEVLRRVPARIQAGGRATAAGRSPNATGSTGRVCWPSTSWGSCPSTTEAPSCRPRWCRTPTSANRSCSRPTPGSRDGAPSSGTPRWPPPS